MPFCQNCGAQLNPEEKFCRSCGEKTGAGEAAFAAGAAAAAEMSQPAPAQEADYQPEYTGQAEAQPDTAQPESAEEANTQQISPDQAAPEEISPDAANNKGMAVLSYLGALVLIPLFARKDSPFARFHINQGLVLMFAEMILSLVKGIVLNVFYDTGTAQKVSLVCTIGIIICCILSLIGLIGAAKGKRKELPVIGKIKLLN
jgi:uncharacterized membrane protein